jgi:hypothetical protein
MSFNVKAEIKIVGADYTKIDENILKEWTISGDYNKLQIPFLQAANNSDDKNLGDKEYHFDLKYYSNLLDRMVRLIEWHDAEVNNKDGSLKDCLEEIKESKTISQIDTNMKKTYKWVVLDEILTVSPKKNFPIFVSELLKDVLIELKEKIDETGQVKFNSKLYKITYNLIQPLDKQYSKLQDKKEYIDQYIDALESGNLEEILVYFNKQKIKELIEAYYLITSDLVFKSTDNSSETIFKSTIPLDEST